jgi:hypothetical protein
MSDLIELRDRLDELAASYRPRPDAIAAARVAGRRFLRWRRAAAAVGSAVAIAAVAAVAAGGLPGLGSPAGARSLPGQRPAAPAGRPVSGTDPSQRVASYGWLPAGFSTDIYASDPQEQPFFTVTAGQKTGLGNLILATYDGMPPIPDLPYAPRQTRATPGRRTPAPPVDGRPAYWTTVPGTAPWWSKEVFELQWEYAPGRWADLSGYKLQAASAAALSREAVRIAASAHFGRPTPVAVPFAVADIPAGLTVYQVQLNTGPPHALISFSGPGSTAWYQATNLLQILVTPARQRMAKPNTTISGYQAYYKRRGDIATLWVYGVRGFDVDIDASGLVLRALPGGLAGLFRHMTVFSSTDPAGWTVTPLRS